MSIKNTQKYINRWHWSAATLPRLAPGRASAAPLLQPLSLRPLFLLPSFYVLLLQPLFLLLIFSASLLLKPVLRRHDILRLNDFVHCNPETDKTGHQCQCRCSCIFKTFFRGTLSDHADDRPCHEKRNPYNVISFIFCNL